LADEPLRKVYPFLFRKVLCCRCSKKADTEKRKESENSETSDDSELSDVNKEQANIMCDTNSAEEHNHKDWFLSTETEYLKRTNR